MPAFPVACSRVGRWWYDELAVDVVSLDEGTETLVLGECKWTSDLVKTGLLDELEAVEPEVHGQGSDRNDVDVLFAKTGYTADPEASVADRDDVLLFDVDAVLDSF